ncbi:hypothetical protein DPMN_044203 [Dreissena polymorpha]|uniref:Uncharacterized protein n=1 Tax=Dreissena polymorpha TaxID=45954 RepID=A0A9D4D2T5_DREPO|nr:hypothetical protein DPMN_044203 [Dreissena polymorpha]
MRKADSGRQAGYDNTLGKKLLLSEGPTLIPTGNEGGSSRSSLKTQSIGSTWEIDSRDRLYITIISYPYKLLTLARDGTLLATYSDPALVPPSGQVLVCGHLYHTVLQLTTLATREDGVWWPEAVCYSSTTSSIIVGQDWDDNILLLLGRDNDAEDVGDKHDAEGEH